MRTCQKIFLFLTSFLSNVLKNDLFALHNVSKSVFFMNKTTKYTKKEDRDTLKVDELRSVRTRSRLVPNDCVLVTDNRADEEPIIEDDISDENTAEYADVFFNELTDYTGCEGVLLQDRKDNFISSSRSSDNLVQLISQTFQNSPTDDLSSYDSSDGNNAIYRATERLLNYNRFPIERNCSSEQDIRFLRRRNKIPLPEGRNLPLSQHIPVAKTCQFFGKNSDLETTNKNFQIFWDFENKPDQLRKFVGLKSSSPFSDPSYLNCSERLRNSIADLNKKRVRFSVSKMENDLNFRATLSIKNEADGQTVFYKVDKKNRFRKEKTIKLMVESMYRIDISFKPTQTLTRAIVRGHEVKTIERVHDSTASAYSLHLPTCNFPHTTKGHRDEISFLIQFKNGLVLQTFLQVKFYKAGDTQHCEWGSTFHCVEYECESYPENGVIAVLKETFR